MNYMHFNTILADTESSQKCDLFQKVYKISQINLKDPLLKELHQVLLWLISVHESATCLLDSDEAISFPTWKYLSSCFCDLLDTSLYTLSMAWPCRYLYRWSCKLLHFSSSQATSQWGLIHIIFPVYELNQWPGCLIDARSPPVIRQLFITYDVKILTELTCWLISDIIQMSLPDPDRAVTQLGVFIALSSQCNNFLYTLLPLFIVVRADKCLDYGLTEGVPSWSLNYRHHNLYNCLLLVSHLLQLIQDVTRSLNPAVLDLDVKPAWIIYANNVLHYHSEVLEVFSLESMLWNPYAA